MFLNSNSSLTLIIIIIAFCALLGIGQLSSSNCASSSYNLFEYSVDIVKETLKIFQSIFFGNPMIRSYYRFLNSSW